MANEKGRAMAILVVEDEVLVAMEMEDRLTAMGYAVIGPAPSVADANDLLDRETPRAALLDVNLGDETVAPIAQRLRDGSIPFALVTGYARLALEDPNLRDVPRLSKPVGDRDLERVLRQLMA